MNTTTRRRPADPWTSSRDRLALETYAARLQQHQERLNHDLEAAHLRLRWQAHERRACQQLRPDEVRALTDIGVIHVAPDDLDDRRLIQRRREQLAALSNLQQLTQHAISTFQDSGRRSELKA